MKPRPDKSRAWVKTRLKRGQTIVSTHLRSFSLAFLQRCNLAFRCFQLPACRRLPIGRIVSVVSLRRRAAKATFDGSPLGRRSRIREATFRFVAAADGDVRGPDSGRRSE